ncbi:hypothetical protein Dimus_023397 [Dionaea muscipula]
MKQSSGEAEVETEGDCERTRQRGSSEGLRPANSANNDHQYFVQGLACVNLKWLSVVENKPRALKGVEGLTKLTVSWVVLCCLCGCIVSGPIGGSIEDLLVEFGSYGVLEQRH